MYQRSGLGALDMTQAVNASQISTANINQGSLDCQWCRANPFWSVVTPACWGLNDQICNFQSIPQAYVAGGVPVVPPDQATINAQTADDTVNQILTQSQLNAIQAATQAASTDTQLQASTSVIPGVCVKGSALYSPVLCFLNDYGILIAIAGVSVFALFKLGGHR